MPERYYNPKSMCFKGMLVGVVIIAFFGAARSHSVHSTHPGAGQEKVDCSASGVSNWSFMIQMRSLFLIMTAGAAGVFLPVAGMGYGFGLLGGLGLSKRTRSRTGRLLELGKFFGIGVILATALIHIYPPALEYLSHECARPMLGSYPGWAGAIFIAAVFLMQLVEYCISHGLSASGSVSDSGISSSSSSGSSLGSIPAEKAKELGLLSTSSINTSTIHSHSHSHGHSHGHGHGFGQGQSLTLSTLLLEASIAFHSVTVGLAVGLTPREETVPLAIAVAVHQLFEGFAVGDRLGRLLANASNNSNSAQASTSHLIGGALVYILAAPAGQAVGMFAHSALQPNSPRFLVLIGSLEALSAGILVYIAIATLMTEEFSAPTFKSYPPARKATCFLAMYCGALAMGIVGNWA